MSDSRESLFEAIGHPEKRDRVLQLRMALVLRQLRYTLLDVMSGKGTVGGEIVRREFVDLPEHGPADLERRLVEFLLRPPRARVPGAALDREHFRARHTLQRFGGLRPDLLHARMAGHVIGHL